MRVRTDGLIMEFVEKFYTKTEATIFKLYYIHAMSSNRAVAKMLGCDKETIQQTIKTIITDIRSRLDIEIKEEDLSDPEPDYTVEEDNNNIEE